MASSVRVFETRLDWRALARLAGLSAALAVAYIALAKGGLAVASVNPNATPIWAPTGLAIAAVLLCGYRVLPAIFVAAFITNATTAGTLLTSFEIAFGNTAEALIACALVNVWSDKRAPLATPWRIGRFGLAALAGTLVSASIGVTSLALAGFASWDSYVSVWTTWWLGDLAGALVVAPAILLWAGGERLRLSRIDGECWALVITTGLVGAAAFGPLPFDASWRGPLAFLAILPLMWAALRRSQRAAAAIALALSLFAVAGTIAGDGPFTAPTRNQAFLMLVAFMISTTLPSLALAADVALRRETEKRLRGQHEELEQRVNDRTAELRLTNDSLRFEIAENKRVWEELEQQRVQLFEAQRVANLGSWSWDGPDGSLVWSDRLYRIFGVKPGSFGNTVKDYLACVHPHDRQRVSAAFDEAMQTGEKFRFDHRIVRPNGEIRHLLCAGEAMKDRDGNRIRLLGVCQDVTELKLAGGALFESEQKYRLLVEGVRDYAICMLDAHGHVTSWSAGAERITGYKSPDIMSRHFSCFYTDEDRAAGLPARTLEIAAETGKYEAEAERMRKDGSRFWANVVIDAIRDPDGSLVGFAKITRDITEQKEAQSALDKARELVSQFQKMEALGQLTGGIAHDFNNLLMVVSGHAQIALRRTSDPKLTAALEAISTATERGASLTRHLLSFSRRQPLNPAVIDLKQRLSSVLEMLARSLREDISLVLEIDDGVWPVEVDVAELELALVNVGVNARDAMPEAGKIVLSAHNTVLTGRETSEALTGDFVTISMSDTGHGISAEVLSRVFEPFFTTKPIDKGTGLGLSQVYGFARQSRGSATIESKETRGTTVTILLPRSHASVLLEGASSKVTPSGYEEGLALVVEDNPSVAQASKAMLEELGFEARVCPNAEDALACVEQDDRIRLVLSDILMPGTMNGVMLMRELRSRRPDLPIVLTSGYTPPENMDDQMPVLRKPFQLAELDHAVRRARAKTA